MHRAGGWPALLAFLRGPLLVSGTARRDLPLDYFFLAAFLVAFFLVAFFLAAISYLLFGYCRAILVIAGAATHVR
jgi:hypothetical protein